MASATVQTRRHRSSTFESPDSGERRFAVRRRIFIALFVCLLIALAVAANYGPITHYLDARGRMEKATAEVTALEERTAEMHADLSRLLQPAHLESLAREELTYARPDEELFIITGDQNGLAADRQADAADLVGSGVGGVVSTSDGSDAAGVGGAAASADGVAEHQPGFLERMLSRIAALF